MDSQNHSNSLRVQLMRTLRRISYPLFPWVYRRYASVEEEETSWQVLSVRLDLPGLPPAFEGFRLVQMSDFHLGGWMTPARLESAFALALQQMPEAFALTGDFVMGYRRTLEHISLPELEQALEKLSRKAPVFAVMGNHDHWALVEQVRDALARAGVRELNNAVSFLQRGQARLYFAGVDDPRTGNEDLAAVQALLPSEGCVILLAHTPDFADVSAPAGQFALQLSGHSHGGQLALPLIGPLVLPRLGRKYPQGLYKIGGMYLYTNRGLGMTRPYVRLNVHPEITVFTLHSA